MDRAVPRRPGNITAFFCPRNYHRCIINLYDRWETHMRKPRNFDAELRALEDKAKELKARKVHQLGELVIATGADKFSVEELAGALVALSETKDPAKKEAWAKRGTAFFQGQSRRSAKAADRDNEGTSTQPGGAQPASGTTGAA